MQTGYPNTSIKWYILSLAFHSDSQNSDLRERAVRVRWTGDRQERERNAACRLKYDV